MSEKVYGISGTNKCRKEVIPKENILILKGHIEKVAKGQTATCKVSIPSNINLNDYIVLAAEQSMWLEHDYRNHVSAVNNTENIFYPIITKREDWIRIEVLNNANSTMDPNGYVNIYYRIVLLKITT